MRQVGRFSPLQPVVVFPRPNRCRYKPGLNERTEIVLD